MRMFKNELMKMFSSRAIVSALVVLLFINGLILFNQTYNSGGRISFYQPSAYREIYGELEGKGNSEQKKYIDDMLDKYWEAYIKGEEVEMTLLYADSEMAESELYYDVKKNVTACEEYDDFLNDIKANATLGTAMGLFADEDTFTYKNVQKTLEDYEHLYDVEPVAGPSKGVILATDSISTDFLIIVAILVVIVALVLREREGSGLGLYKATCKGRLPLAWAKASVVLLSSATLVVIFYGFNYLFAAVTYSFGDLSRPVQSISELSHCILEISIGEYLIVYMLAKLVAVAVIAMFFYLIAVLSSSATRFYIITVVASVALASAYYGLTAVDRFALLKYLNPVAFLDTNTVIGYYRNLNIAGNPVNYAQIFWIGSLVVIALLAYYSCLLFADIKESSLSGVSRFSGFIKDKTGRNTSVLAHESYKCLVNGKILFIILAFAIYVYGSYKPAREAYYIMEDNIYNGYVSGLFGSISDEKIDFVDSEVLRMEELKVEMEIRISEAENEEQAARIAQLYEDKLIVEEAVNKLDTHTKYLETVEGDYYVDTGYKLLTGADIATERDAWLALIAVLVLIVCLSYIYSVEYAKGANVLLRTTQKGRGRTLAYKSIIGFVTIMSVLALTYVPVYYSVFSEFGTEGINLKACSMQHLSDIPGSISVLQYLIIINVLRVTGMIIMMYAIFYISSRMKSMVATILASLVLFVLPIILLVAGVPGAEYMMLNYLIV